MNLIDALNDPRLLAPHFEGESWHRWRVLAKAIDGLLLDAEEMEIFTQHTGRTVSPCKPVREVWPVCGRGAGKSRFTGAQAAIRAAIVDYTPLLAPGERAYVGIFSADKAQSRVLFNYIDGIFESVPLLAGMIVNQTQESIELSNRVIIQVKTSNFRTLRGPRYVFAACDEIAYWRSEESANPDQEIVGALRPSLARTPGSLLMAISSPYARKGMLWEMYKRYFGKNDARILIWQASTISMNPTFDEAEIVRATAEDESAAAAEYQAQFRRDIETYINREAVDSVVIPGRHELPYCRIQQYYGFVDPSGGSSDSMTLAISHRETINGKDRSILDLVREIRPPFSPESAVQEFAQALQSYGIATVVGDRYAGEFPRELFRKCGIAYETSDKTKSEIYQELLPLINSQRVELLDHPRLINQLCNLERRTARSGKDSIDHAPHAHDDLINSAAGALVAATGPRYTTRVVKIIGW